MSSAVSVASIVSGTLVILAPVVPMTAGEEPGSFFMTTFWITGVLMVGVGILLAIIDDAERESPKSHPARDVEES